MIQTRIDRKFSQLKQQQRTALVTYMMAGDPDEKASLALMECLAENGSDLIELGVPFSDPMADGPTIQAAGLRALKGGQTLAKTLDLARNFRLKNDDTPIILMGYYNPIYRFGVETFLQQAVEAGVDGLIIVDLPPEMDKELCIPAREAGINFIRLATPTTDDNRLPKVLQNTSGFVYYVSMTGITGQALPDTSKISASVSRIKAHTDLPIVVGFGIKSGQQAGEIGKIADGSVVGSAIVKTIADCLDDQGKIVRDPLEAVANLVQELRTGIDRA